ncbi:hypothetical protein ACFVFH_15010 [Streptomyces sp. NPDC057697]|uniref:hypothetical protein n=1 Tax=Streptomyces sp. NPDC057697 TaxID=3346219 RepID=UPI0036ADA8A3
MSRTHASYTLLATRSSPAAPTGVWNFYEPNVTTARLISAHSVANNTKYTVTAADSAWHGAFHQVETVDSVDGGTNDGLIGPFRDVSYTSG